MNMATSSAVRAAIQGKLQPSSEIALLIKNQDGDGNIEANAEAAEAVIAGTLC